MARGDVASGISGAIADDAYMTIRPASGEEIVVHHVFHEGDIEIEHYNGSVSVFFDSHAGRAPYSCDSFHATYTNYFRVKNVNGAAQDMSWDGIVTKTP
jgi:hypothetical protein